MENKAVDNDSNKEFSIGDIVKDGNDYKIVCNVSGTWKDMKEYEIIDITDKLIDNYGQWYFGYVKAGTVIIIDNSAYFTKYDANYTNYPQDLVNQNGNWVKLDL